MKKLLLAIFTNFLCLSQALATHIVGGEFELQVVKGQSGVSHRLNMNLYFDDINGSVAAIDQQVNVGFFSKKNNILIGYVSLPLVSNNLIGYTNPACSQAASVRTRLIQYSQLINLNPDNFTEAEGYYIVWERCCRNNVISNIQNPGAAGSIFFLTFPPLKQNNLLFINSSPSFKVLTGDYICINRPFVFEFGATDSDGDELRYSLVTPFNSYVSTKDDPKPVLPEPIPSNRSGYPTVNWANGYDILNVIPGSNPLKVNSKTGQLTVTANKTGLYVFCVLTEEYRNGIKIGEVRRDFQLSVIDCPINNAPNTLFKEKGKSGFYDSANTLTVKLGDKKCFTLLGTDQDPNQILNLKVIPVNFKSNPTISPSTLQSSSSKDTLRAEVCFDECTESLDGKPFVFDVITSDNGCPQPLTNTLRMSVIFEPRPNFAPTISSDLFNQRGESEIGKLLKFNLFGIDKDNDNITLTARGQGFSLAQAGMSFAGGSGVGKVTSPFTWTPVCDPTRKSDYVVDFIVTDTRCGRNLKDSISVTLKFIPPKNDQPVVKTSLIKNEVEVILNGTEPQPINFDVISTDINSDPLKLYAQPKGFDLKSVGMVWTDASGVAKIINPFAWKPECSYLKGKESAIYNIDFITEDNTCSPYRFDTVRVVITLKNKISNFDILKTANVFTPNGDGLNDDFSLKDLPEDNCTEKFEFIEIYDRWGQPLFKSTERNFKWTGGQYSASEYHYLIKFTEHLFKGWVELIR
jgi:gliding motility-associated-like protein